MAFARRRSSLKDSLPETPCKWDLSKYVSLGCLVIEQFFSQEDEEFQLESCTWKELDVRSINATGHFATAVGYALLNLVISGWVRAFALGSAKHNRTLIRIHVLPHDVGRDVVNRDRKELSGCLKALLQKQVDYSSAAWHADFENLDSTKIFDPWAQKEDYSLHYLFNNLPSPTPEPRKVQCEHSRQAMQELLDLSGPPRGFRSTLYPFQAKAAALMLQRECNPERIIDPTLELRHDAEGRPYYYSPRFGYFFREERFYESNRGGILAESMGLGKTVICLALIVATKGHTPAFPAQYPLCLPDRGKIKSLKEICAATIVRNSIPWKAYYGRIEEEESVDMSPVKQVLQDIVPYYEVAVEKARLSRNHQILPPIRKTMCGGTVIVVPPNLMKQWKTELQKHVQEGVLRAYYMENPKQVLPPATELAEYDVVLFTKSLFERESVDGQDRLGRRLTKGAQMTCQCPYIGSTRQKDCTCLSTDELYVSPLKELHWLRIIVDEGHSFSTRNTRAASVMERLITAERRWVVSGTPAKDLVGIEVDLSIEDVKSTKKRKGKAIASYPEEAPQIACSVEEIYDAAAAQRKFFSYKEDTAGAAKALGSLATHFLRVRPWANTREDTEGLISWEDHVYRHEDWSSRTYSSFSRCMSEVLKGLIIKTRMEDVEKDLQLPPLVRKTVRLEPSFLDKTSANLFTQVLRANAVTSERTDQDYLFHPKGVKARTELIKNLRHSTFAWTGFQKEDVQKSVEVSSKYLDAADTHCTLNDRTMLSESLDMARIALKSKAWHSLSQHHEIGLFVNTWPDKASVKWWTLDFSSCPIMTGPRLLMAAQKYIDDRLDLENPLEGFGYAGESAMFDLRREADSENLVTKESHQNNNKLERTGIPISCTTGERDARHITRTGKTSPQRNAGKPRPYTTKKDSSAKSKKRKHDSSVTELELEDRKKPSFQPSSKLSSPITDLPRSSTMDTELHTVEPAQNEEKPVKRARFADTMDVDVETITYATSNKPKSILKNTPKSNPISDMSQGVPDTPVGKIDLKKHSIVGTSSAKLSYILSKVIAHEADEKIIIFFDSNNHAYYISECLELLNIPHLIYVRSLKPDVQSAYIDSFNNSSQVRVLLMDIVFGAHGLNLNAASMVLFVNPVCRPDIEAQAVKRAHRIGQKRQVLVETLVLKGTVEEAMLERAEHMTRGEHKQAKLLEDDAGIKSIIQNAKVFPIGEEDDLGKKRMVPLDIPQQIFDRPDKGRSKKIKGIDKDESEKAAKKSTRGKGKDKGEGAIRQKAKLFMDGDSNIYSGNAQKAVDDQHMVTGGTPIVGSEAISGLLARSLERNSPARSLALDGVGGIAEGSGPVSIFGGF